LKVAALFAVVLMVAACATPTTLANKATQLRPGVTTEAEAALLLGPPNSRTVAGAGTLLQWFEMNTGLASAKAAHLAVLFDASGRMVRITHQSRTDP
jgi:hypothetical protein